MRQHYTAAAAVVAAAAAAAAAAAVATRSWRGARRRNDRCRHTTRDNETDCEQRKQTLAPREGLLVYDRRISTGCGSPVRRGNLEREGMAHRHYSYRIECLLQSRLPVRFNLDPFLCLTTSTSKIKKLSFITHYLLLRSRFEMRILLASIYSCTVGIPS